MAEVVENAPHKTPLTILGSGNAMTHVYDHDLGSNGTFELFIDSKDDIFDVIPKRAVNEASFILQERMIDISYWLICEYWNLKGAENSGIFFFEKCWNKITEEKEWKKLDVKV